MRKYLLLLLTGVFLVGCGSSLKSSWNNFTAYYNTFYNARESFKSGLKKVNNQPLTIDPSSPARIHPAPNKAGYNDFQNAIDKGAQVLRKFPESKWVDDAILLIGKSNYYRQEFYPALQKFEELINAGSSPEMISRAIIWKSRTQLDLKQYTAGVSFVESELEQYPSKWPRKYRGEIQALAGQHHVMLENWGEAVDYLFDATSNIQSKSLLGRTYFLLGQVLEQQERYEEAFNAFGEVKNNFPDFDYLYWSQFKQADIARKATRFDLALDIFQTLRKDDKNLDRRGRLLFEIGRTYEMMGEAGKAEKMFKNLLYGTESQQPRDLKADIYFRLGKIYSDQYNQYQVAAAYFDSSSTINSSSPNGSDSDNPAELADTYGEYTELKKSITRADSLLRLGSLSEQELDSALNAIRAQMQRELEKNEGEESTVFANTEIAGVEDAGTSEIPTQYGYLNYKNAQFVKQYKTQFRLRWGDRPLVDNWRRAEAIRGAERQEDFEVTDNNQSANSLDNIESVVELNLEEIPRTAEQKNQLRTVKANAQYKLGNLLFLNLNMPDSARHYFHKVLKNDIAKELHPPAMYSLFEIFSTEDNTDSLQYWGKTIQEKYPQTRYARRVKVRMGDGSEGTFEQDTTKKLINQYYRHLQDTTSQKAVKLRKLALDNRDSDLAPHIFYQSIEAYINRAKDNSDFVDSTDKRSLTADSSDTSRVDSATTAAILKKKLDFSGASWDSVRFAIQQFDTTFPNAKQQKRVNKLSKLLQEHQSGSQENITCKDLGISLNVEPSMESFLKQVTYPKRLEGMSLSGNVTYSFVVREDGKVKSYELISQKTSLGIEESFEEAFDDHLQFAPLEAEQAPDEITCRISFPIRR
ncbi:tetratricopeptide repeat protein [Fodinibius sp.]|uniref:type IX secretion system periplasmic lipoprotein PorW/SprE n=1 Tax=Fodinibius sp. TaxID=1872440 RepID=UPI002ACE26BD|nr:tetratricopeptide repeat protein [Fodinibius sp.]MDZ7657805.1 tetratricopeptide repeat protein [Fodinibius sp.]